MGQYTRHWNRYRRDRKRGLLYIVLLFVVGLILLAAVSFMVARYTLAPLPVLIGGLFLWIVVLVFLLVRQWRVICPRCGERYLRGKHHACPDCGLGYLQEDIDASVR